MGGRKGRKSRRKKLFMAALLVTRRPRVRFAFSPRLHILKRSFPFFPHPAQAASSQHGR